ncbi:hypothetical protein HETIRDRAFT_166543 [Heterobasidion irregulare TC 32-1]|uniref:Uncharacterized protein n=1 Tax=Heterobasidion irregulare (strain TC 32-1) TaxID=747525 RepID=W4KNQ5_HETIT|nr:uncharacterized protein HETIRDRAFT_166543 [Heterobasidion irregulare TC 32-1]ETW87020.1 hypothetical protein HETIRDRAFT_166543 [Heterobasidion irregulare TC 32-1]
MSDIANKGPPHLGHLVEVYATLLIAGGQAGLPIIILTFLFAKNVHRHPTVVNFCITMIIYSIVFCLLIYGGQYRLGHPNKALCIAQASMIMGTLPMMCVAALVLVFQLWVTFQEPGSKIFNTCSNIYIKIALLVAPYTALLGYAVAGIIIGVSRPEVVKPSNGLYCFHKLNSIRRYAEPIPCLILLAATAGFEVAILVQWYRRWYKVKRNFPLATRKLGAMVCLRAGLFTLYSWVALGSSISFVFDTVPALPYMIEAGLPVAAFIVFATQRDVIEAWCFWRRTSDNGIGRRPSTAALLENEGGSPMESVHRQSWQVRV